MQSAMVSPGESIRVELDRPLAHPFKAQRIMSTGNAGLVLVNVLVDGRPQLRDGEVKLSSDMIAIDCEIARRDVVLMLRNDAPESRQLRSAVLGLAPASAFSRKG